MPTITIDGKTIEVPEGAMLLPVALENGIHIPHYCWHPKLSIDGSCRMCQVEIEGVPKLSIACNTPVRDGMVVHTDTAKVQNTRRGVMELLLVNHPLDCPICDKAGECLLQDYSFAYGSRESKSSEPRRKLEKRKDIGPRMILDQERCILCRRCVRFCREITKTSELGVFNMGERSVLDVLDEKPLANDYSICTADVCPVGALESKDFHHKLRVWFLKKTPSVCAGCSNGCNITVHHYRGRVWRLMPRRNDAVNDTWMCDAGRLGYTYVNDEQRLRRPQRRRNGALEAVPWDEALATVAGYLRDGARSGVAAIASPHLTNEESFRFSKLLEVCGVTEVAVAVRSGNSDDFLIKAEKAANARGARDMGLERTSVSSVLQAAADGRLSTLYVCGNDIFAADSALVERALAGVAHLIVQEVAPSALTERAEVVLPSLTFAEKIGTFTNHAGRVQAIHRAIEPLDGQPCDGELFSRLLSLVGEGHWAFDPRRVLAEEIAATVPGYAELTFDMVGAFGVAVDRSPAGADS
jgi:NADH-quinone oxidoreductase subunit G